MAMEATESLERVSEGLSRAASCCRELAKMLHAHEWGSLSTELLVMREKAINIYKSIPLTEIEIHALVSEMELAQRKARQLSVH